MYKIAYRGFFKLTYLIWSKEYTILIKKSSDALHKFIKFFRIFEKSFYKKLF